MLVLMAWYGVHGLKHYEGLGRIELKGCPRNFLYIDRYGDIWYFFMN